MSQIDIYRNSITRKKSELADLRKKRSAEVAKASNCSQKIISAKKTLKSTKSSSTANSKLREIEKAERAISDTDKKVSDLEKRISKKEKDILGEEKKLRQAEEREQKKQNSDEKKRITESTRLMEEMHSDLIAHEFTQLQIQRELEELKKIPESITVLFMASNPRDTMQLRLDEEARSINEMIRKSEHRNSVNFETRWATRSSDILQAINELNPSIIHFSGHGSDTEELVLQDANGNAKLVSKEAIVQVMMTSSDQIRLVFFNTCFSYTQAEAVVENVEAAIGMTASIGDEAARVFAAQFYSSIGFGLSVKRAFDQAKGALMLEGIPEENTPALYVRKGLDSNELVIVNPDNENHSSKRKSHTFGSINITGDISGVQIQQATTNSTQSQKYEK